MVSVSKEKYFMYKISVIIPIYNDEKYLSSCIEHIINQKIGFENIQLILIDDNSSDKSYSIALSYQQKFPNNIILQKLDINSGYGGKPRNIGIDIAEGKYLMFSDSDDFFAENAFEIMYNAIESKEADFIISNWNYADYDGKPWSKPVFDTEKFQDFKLAINDYTNSFYVMNSSMCNKIFNREFILKNKIRCLEDVPGEDTYFSMSAFLSSQNVYYIKDITYYYRQRDTSHKVTSVSWDCSKTFFHGMNIAYKETYNKFIEKNQIQFYRFLYARNMTYLLYRFIDSTKLTKEDRLELLAELRWFFKLSYTLKVPPCQKSLTILIDKIVIGEYADAIDICKIIAEIRTYLPEDTRYKMSKPYEQMYEEILKKQLKDGI